MSNIFLSIIIPAYNEQNRIGNFLEEVSSYLSDKSFKSEVLVVIDGATDDTEKVVSGFLNKIKNLRIINNDINKGKGYVVRQGFLESDGKYKVFLDADGSTSITHIDKALEICKKNNCDMIVGSRDIEGSNIEDHQPKYREFMGTMGNLLVRAILGLWEFPDTQCGFKLITSNVSDNVVPKMKVDRFGFDFELIAVAKYLGYKIEQMPVDWVNVEGTTVRFFGPNGFLQVIVDLFKTKNRLILGNYREEDNN